MTPSHPLPQTDDDFATIVLRSRARIDEVMKAGSSEHDLKDMKTLAHDLVDSWRDTGTFSSWENVLTYMLTEYQEAMAYSDEEEKKRPAKKREIDKRRAEDVFVFECLAEAMGIGAQWREVRRAAARANISPSPEA